TLGLQLGGNPYERSRGKTDDGWQLWGRAPWAVSHIQFVKHPNEPLRLRHVLRASRCGRTLVVVSSRVSVWRARRACFLGLGLFLGVGRHPRVPAAERSRGSPVASPARPSPSQRFSGARV